MVKYNIKFILFMGICQRSNYQNSMRWYLMPGPPWESAFMRILR